MQKKFLLVQSNWGNVKSEALSDEILGILLTGHHPFILLSNQDPSHERAGSNMRYFEMLLEREKENQVLNETTDATEAITQGGIYERPQDYLPERDIYEALCRGEGVKMVRERDG